MRGIGSSTSHTSHVPYLAALILLFWPLFMAGCAPLTPPAALGGIT